MHDAGEGAISGPRCRERWIDSSLHCQPNRCHHGVCPHIAEPTTDDHTLLCINRQTRGKAGTEWLVGKRRVKGPVSKHPYHA